MLSFNACNETFLSKSFFRDNVNKANTRLKNEEQNRLNDKYVMVIKTK